MDGVCSPFLVFSMLSWVLMWALGGSMLPWVHVRVPILARKAFIKKLYFSGSLYGLCAGHYKIWWTAVVVHASIGVLLENNKSLAQSYVPSFWFSISDTLIVRAAISFIFVDIGLRLYIVFTTMIARVFALMSYGLNLLKFWCALKIWMLPGLHILCFRTWH